MITYNAKTFLTLQESSTVLNMTVDALRQRIARGVLTPIKISSRLCLDAETVANFHSQRTGLPRLETAKEFNKEEFIAESEALRILGRSKYYLRPLIAKGKIKAFISSEGVRFIPKSALDKFILGDAHNDLAYSL